MITLNALTKIRLYNERGLHYNLVADAVYKMRSAMSDAFGPEYLPYIIAALISFDMGRMMGSGDGKYDTKVEGFARCMIKKLITIKPYIMHLMDSRLDTLSIESQAHNIKRSYDILSSAENNCLHQKGKEFHVGATKILHFLNPQTFIMVDRNAARAFKLSHHVGFANTTQPGYSSDRYIECMRYAKRDIFNYGIEDFCTLEANVPIARIYDKLTFVTGSEMT